MTQRFTHIVQFLILIGLISVTAMLIMLNGAYKVSASAPSGLPASFATTSSVTVGTDKPNAASTTVAVFGTATNCASRVITTVSQPIMLMFSKTMISSTTANPTGQIGHLQAASTTVAYDSGIYGCGFVSAFGFATTTITVTEFQ